MNYLSLYEGSLSLQEREIFRENHNQSKWGLVEPDPNGYIYKTGRGVDRLVKIRGLGCCCVMCLQAVSEAAPTNAQQHDCLNRS